MTQTRQARRYYVRGRVQGVGFRYFVQQRAVELGVRGFTRNLSDGRVEVYAIGTESQLSGLEGYLRTGPRWSDVRGVDCEEAAVENYRSFQIES